MGAGTDTHTTLKHSPWKTSGSRTLICDEATLREILLFREEKKKCGKGMGQEAGKETRDGNIVMFVNTFHVHVITASPGANNINEVNYILSQRQHEWPLQTFLVPLFRQYRRPGYYFLDKHLTQQK